MTYKHVAISQQSFDYLDALAESWSMDKKELVENMIMYFRLTGDDPTATKKDNTAVAIKKLQNTVVSFIKTHETDHLLKIVNDFEETRKALALSQTKQTGELKTLIEAGRKDDKERLNAWMVNGMELKDGVKFSVKNRFDFIAEKEQEIIKLIKNMSTKNDKKKEVL